MGGGGNIVVRTPKNPLFDDIQNKNLFLLNKRVMNGRGALDKCLGLPEILIKSMENKAFAIPE